MGVFGTKYESELVALIEESNPGEQGTSGTLKVKQVNWNPTTKYRINTFLNQQKLQKYQQQKKNYTNKKY